MLTLYVTLFYLLTVSPGQPISISDDAEVVTLVGNSQDPVNQINQKEIHWGVSLESCFYFNILWMTSLAFLLFVSFLNINLHGL